MVCAQASSSVQNPKSKTLPERPPSPARPAKRAKLQALDPNAPTSAPDDDAGPSDSTSVPVLQQDVTGDAGLEATLSAVPKDEDVKAYEASRRGGGKWKRSIYVDAFNLALDTVLKDESYLFAESETEVFAKYRSLGYEAQYLYVRLFLRKSDKWFRVKHLGYHSDIADMEGACALLQSKDVAFAETEADIDSLEEAADLLYLDELKKVAKDAKCSGSNKTQLVAALKKASGKQGSLRAGGQLTLNFDRKGNYVNQNKFFIKNILRITGSCIRLSSGVRTLFDRVHLVFYRSTEWSEKSLTTVILSRTLRRNFPDYIVSRTSNIFPTRSSLLEFEKAIKLQSEVDELLEPSSGGATQDALQKVLGIFESVYGPWRRLVAEEAEKAKSAAADEALERVYLRRFSAAWVYTRIVHKGVYVLGRLKEHKREHAVLAALLAQRYFQSARRGGWYQRKALIEEHYMASLDTATTTTATSSTSSSATVSSTTTSTPSGAARQKQNKQQQQQQQQQQKKWWQQALATCEAGLQDPLTHIIFHHDLQKRVLKLELRLRVPKRDQHDFGHARLRKPSERVVVGRRVNDAAVGRKTLWRDPADLTRRRQCSVEEMCLSVYRAEGWKGFHCEGGVVRTLFACLFYDIFFLYLPNVFETEFQTCPLDLFTDAFYPQRASEINHRLVAIANGAAPALLRTTWERERVRRTCVVGLDWSYALADLLEIAECIPGDALSVLCKVLCQEYRQRNAGMPDLFLWNYSRRECLFAEVKSENDRLSDTQRLWIHVLTGAGLRVELCAAKNSAKDQSK